MTNSDVRHLPPTSAGIHHVTALASDPQRNHDFYTEVLGLRLVKQTVNFDDPSTYHLYFGDELGRPGTLMTFFPWPGARPGVRGAGQATAVAFAVPEGSLGFWGERLSAAGVATGDAGERFGRQVLSFEDPDGLFLDLIADPEAAGTPWPAGPVPEQHAVRAFHSVTLTVAGGDATSRVLSELLGYGPAGEEGARRRFRSSSSSEPAALVDLVVAPAQGPGRIAAGSVHHVAFRTADSESQTALRRRILQHGLSVSPVAERCYFRSIYFREPGGVLFEVATDGPGSTWDEAPDQLGSALRLPPWLEPRRAEIAASLPPVRVSGARSTAGASA